MLLFAAALAMLWILAAVIVLGVCVAAADGDRIVVTDRRDDAAVAFVSR